MSFIKKNWIALLAGFVAFILISAPSFSTDLYRHFLPIPKGISDGDLLSYFGVSLGLIGSTSVFLANKSKEQSDLEAIRTQERNNNRPHIVVECAGNKYGVYPKLKLTNVGINPVTHVRIFDKEIVGCLQPGESFEVTIVTNPLDNIDSSRLLLDKSVFSGEPILGCPASTKIEATGVRYGSWSASLTAYRSGTKVFYSEDQQDES